MKCPIRCQPSTFLWEDRSHREQGLFHIDNQGCHVVRMLDAKGDGWSTGLVQGHLEEEEGCEELSQPGKGSVPPALAPKGASVMAKLCLVTLLTGDSGLAPGDEATAQGFL